MKIKIPLFILFSINMLFAQAQEVHNCQMEGNQETVTYYQETKKDFKKFYEEFQANPQRDLVTYIPVQAHIINKTDGTAGISETEVTDQLAKLNAIYVHSNIQFIFCEDINIINNTNWWAFSSNEEGALRAAHFTNNVINIYFPKAIAYNGVITHGYTYFPGGGPDFIAVDLDVVSNYNALAHEIGHYFSLFHTHETINGAEYVNGSNCSTAGDLICDTPAEPDLTGSLNYYSNYVGSESDPLGVPYAPDTENIMQYGTLWCKRMLTDEQYARVAYSAQNQRNYLACPDAYCESSGGAWTNTYFEQTTVFYGVHDSDQIQTGFTGGYSNFTDYNIPALTNPVPQYLAKFKVARPNNNYTLYSRAWLDFNNDGDFDDAGEMISEHANPFDGKLLKTFTVGIDETTTQAVNGPVRLRVSTRLGSYPTSCLNNFNGEVEDYIVVFSTEGSTDCVPNYDLPAPFVMEDIDFDGMVHEHVHYQYDNENILVVNIAANHTYTMSYDEYFDSWTPPIEHGYTHVYFKVWADFNNDGDFTDAGELIRTSPLIEVCGECIDGESIPFIVPSTAASNFRMRVLCTSELTDIANAGPCSYYPEDTDFRDFYVNVVPGFCSSSGAITSYEWIESLRFKTVGNDLGNPVFYENQSGDDGGYGNYSIVHPIPLQKGFAYPFELVPGFGGIAYSEYWRMWIDYNRDGDYTDDGEEVFAPTSPSANTQTGFLVIPTTVEEGPARMRIAMSYGSAPPECGTFTYGEIEDYTINIGPMAAANLNGPSGLPAFTETTQPVIHPLGNTPPREGLKMDVFPNPTNGPTTISANLALDQKGEISLYNTLGKKLISKEVIANTTTLDCSQFSTGIYFLKLEAVGTTKTARLQIYN